MAGLRDFVGFPEGVLLDKPVRLKVLSNNSRWFILDKHAGLSAQAHPWHSNLANVTNAIRQQIQGGKAELKRLGIGEVHFICGPEPEVAGPVLFAKSKEVAHQLNNLYGSDLFQFSFHFFTSLKREENSLLCQLPVAPHHVEPRSLISHKTGKKSTTRFTRIARGEFLDLWRAETQQSRMHQIRLHASEVGIPVLGDSLYGDTTLEKSERFHRNPRGGRFCFRGLGLILNTLRALKGLPEFVPISGKVPQSFSTLLRKCGFERQIR